jgi:hypothetical protein
MKIKNILLALLFSIIAIASYGKRTYITLKMIEELNPANFKSNFSDYNQSTSLFCAQLSDAAYLDSSDFPVLEYILNLKYQENKFKLLNLETKRHARALLFFTKDFLIIAFRGTEFNIMRDIITDIKILPYTTTGNLKLKYHNLQDGHGGFRRGIMDLITEKYIFEKMDSMINLYSNVPNTFPIYLTGHSMGAAYSSMFTNTLITDTKYNFSGAYNFAPPLAISCKNARDICCTQKGEKIYDIVNYLDYVPRASRKGRHQYSHIGKFYRISGHGLIFREDEHYIKRDRKEKGLKKLIEFHSLNSYKAAIRFDKNTNDDIKQRYEKNETAIPGYFYPVVCRKCPK